MTRASRLAQLAAFVLLLLAGVEIGLCAEWSPDDCRFSHEHSGSTSASGDECLCCCAHLLVLPTLSLSPGPIIQLLLPSVSARMAFVAARPIYHPPQA